ncbi:UNVERIFIED_CONTAM: hypothetical protein K2H54_074042 [Gekko kuhli]
MVQAQIQATSKLSMMFHSFKQRVELGEIPDSIHGKNTIMGHFFSITAEKEQEMLAKEKKVVATVAKEVSSAADVKGEAQHTCTLTGR